ncbi:MAG: murein hydrolase activator EnvC family protein [Dehalococcoidia bacterium]
MAEDPQDNQQELDRRKYMADRMARLRDAARNDRKYFGELVVGDTPAAGRKLKPLLMVAAVGGVAVAALVMAFSLTRGGGSPDATIPAGETGQPGNVPPANGADGPGGPAPTRAATRASSPTPSPTADVKTTDPAEGAVGRNAIQVVDAISLSLRLPVRGPLRVVEPFGASRGNGDLVHAGIDLASAVATPFEVVAACDGQVTSVQQLTGYGEFVVVDCGRNWRTVYAQLASTSVKTGDLLTAGESVIGTSGRFLHFEIRFSGAPVDPSPALTAAASVTPTPTETPTPEPTPTETPTPGATVGGAATPEPPPGGTATPPPPTATATPTATSTPTPAPTPTPTRPPVRTPTPKPGIR